MGKTQKIGNATIMNIDCMEYMKTLPDKFFDLAVCDPPYGIGRDGSNKSTSSHGGRKYYEFKGWDNDIPEKEYFDNIFKISKNVILWGANYFCEFLPPSMGWIFWDKGQRICNSDGELAFSSFNRALRVVEYNRVEIQKDGAIHPTQKPVKLYEWILTNYAKPGQTIFDSHMGSGSSAIACNNLGFEYVGCELDTDYYEAACKRIAHHASQKRLFA